MNADFLKKIDAALAKLEPKAKNQSNDQNDRLWKPDPR